MRVVASQAGQLASGHEITLARLHLRVVPQKRLLLFRRVIKRNKDRQSSRQRSAGPEIGKVLPGIKYAGIALFVTIHADV